MSSPTKKESFPSSDEKESLIRETIIYGSIKHIAVPPRKLPEALTFILEREESIGWVDRVIINYKTICSRIEEMELETTHYAAGKGVHFLVKLLTAIDRWSFPETGSILCSTREEFKEHIVSIYVDCSIGLIKEIAQLPLAKQIPLGTKLGLFVIPLYKEHNNIPAFPHLLGEVETTAEEFKANPNFIACMFTDSYSLLPHFNREMVGNLVLRLLHLNGVAPLYFAKMQVLLKEKLIAIRDIFSVDEIITLSRVGFSLIKGFTAEELRKLSPGAWRLACISNPWILGYYLGFDPRNGEVPFSCLKNALFRLSSVGPVSYAEEVLPKEWRHPFDQPTSGTCAEVDIMLNRICDYNPFDIVRYYEGGCSWIITRPSFENILTTRENPYSREAIPHYALEEIRRRLDLVAKCRLPTASSIVELLKSYESKTDAEQKAENAPPEITSPRPPMFDQLLPGSFPLPEDPSHFMYQDQNRMVYNNPVQEDFNNMLHAVLIGALSSGLN